MLLEAIATSATKSTHLTTLVNYLISTYFLNLSAVLIVHNSSHRSDLQKDYLNSVQLAFTNQSTPRDQQTGLLWIDVSAMQQEDFDEQILRTVNIVIEGFITILPATTPFLLARYFATRNAKLRLKDKFHLFLCEKWENPTDLLATEILQFYPHHLMVRPQLNENTNHHNESLTWSTIAFLTFELWTQKYVGAVDNLDVILLDAFLPNKTFVYNAELYPNKISNLEGRIIKLGSITYIPYVVTNYVTDEDEIADPIIIDESNRSVFYAGSEAELMKTFCKTRNCHLRVKPYGVDNWGAIYENETSTGMLGELYQQRVEVAIGCIYNWYDEITETSNTIARSAVTLLGPAPGLTPPWYTNIAPFSTQLWIFLISTMLLSAVMLYIIKLCHLLLENFKLMTNLKISHFYLFQQACLDIFAIFLQQPSAPNGLKRIAARIFIVLLLLSTITLENTYSGQLKSILTVPIYTEPVDTIDKWSKTNWKWAAPSDIWVETVAQSMVLKEIILTKSFHTYDYNTLYNISFRNDHGLGIERLMSGVFTFGKYITPAALENKIVLKDDLYFDWTRAVAIRGWPLMPILNKHVRLCMESGLYEHWEKKNVMKYLDQQTLKIFMSSDSGLKNKDPPKKLTFENIAGAVFVLLFGHLLAIVTILLEIFGYYLKEKLLKLWKIYFLRDLCENKRK